MGWFYGFKLHLIINDKGEILNFTITQASTDDREPLKNQSFIKKLFGKLYADKGYIGKELMLNLFNDGIHLITHIKNNMKNSLMTMRDKILLRKRSVIETVNDELKNMCQIEHSRHRSIGNFLTNLISGLIAYYFFPKKPSIKFEVQKNKSISAFLDRTQVNSKPMSTYIEISPAIMQDGGTNIFEKYWKVSDLSNTAVPTVINEDEEEPNFISHHFENMQGVIIEQEEIDDKINLIIESINGNGRSITINLDDELLDYEYNGKRLENDILKNITVTGDFTTVELKAIKQKK